MKKYLFALLFVSLIALSSCGKINKEPETATEPRDPNAPDNVVADGAITETPPETAAQTEITPETELPESETMPESTTAETTAPPETSEDTKPSETEPETEAETDPEPEEPEADTRAIECLKLLNSDCVHAKFIQAESFGGGDAITTSVEYFVNGGDRIYTVNAVRRIISGGTVTVIDDLNRFYMTFPDDSERGLDFGYDISLYKLISSDSEQEVYEIEGEDLTSKWRFSGGSIKVTDVFSDGSFTLYDIEALDTDFSDMDYSIPAGYEEVDAEDYEFYR